MENKKNKKNNSSKSLVFGRWPQTKITDCFSTLALCDNLTTLHNCFQVCVVATLLKHSNALPTKIRASAGTVIAFLLK